MQVHGVGLGLTLGALQTNGFVRGFYSLKITDQDMRLLLLFLFIVAVYADSEAEIVARAEEYLRAMDRRDLDLNRGLSKRSFTSANYTPEVVKCPSDSLLRSASGLNVNETAYVASRDNVTRQALISFLDRIELDDFEASEFLTDNSSIHIGLAFSGGSYRAMLNGAGFLAAADNRTVNATEDGHIGGLLQASTYIVGLSGGNWLVNSVVLNNFSSVQDLQADKVVWDLSNSLLAPKGANVTAASEYFAQVADEVSGKFEAGFSVSLTDYWGRLLAQQFFNYTSGGLGLTYSDIVETPAFKSFELPYPIVVAISVTQNESVTINTTDSFEFSPYEMGTWDSDIKAFFPTRYLGTEVVNGKPADKCVNGFDNAGFVTGTSSSLFNVSPLNSSVIQSALFPSAILNALDDANTNVFYRGVANYQPNPFFGISKDPTLALADGGIDGQNVPLLPLLQPDREVDVIFAVDNSAELDSSFPDGSALIATYDRQFTRDSFRMPKVPDANTFVANNLTAHPTFFGCNETDTPLIVYLANYPYSYATNGSTIKLTYSTEEIAGYITNGYNLGTQGNGTLESGWSQCVACAIIQREQSRRNITQSDQCAQCFEKHCWNDDLATQNATTEQIYPDLLLNQSVLQAASSSLSSAVSAATSSPASASASTTTLSSASSVTPISTTSVPASASAMTSSAASSTASASATSTGAANKVSVSYAAGLLAILTFFLS